MLRLDGAFLGRTPLLTKVQPGKHLLEVSHDGYQPNSLSMDLKPGQTLPLDLKLVPIAVPRSAPPSTKKPATPPRIASVEPSKSAPPPKAEQPARGVAPAPPPKGAAPASTQKPATPPRTVSVEPPKGAPPKPAPPLGPSPLPRPKPDLAGIVTGAMSASTIKVGDRWIELYGIADPTRNSRRHIEALKRYLTPAHGRVECYRKAPRKYQCYSGGRDLALLALRDGIARPARDAPSDYREAALGGEARRKQP
jgi:hypothetical protein